MPHSNLSPLQTLCLITWQTISAILTYSDVDESLIKMADLISMWQCNGAAVSNVGLDLSSILPAATRTFNRYRVLSEQSGSMPERTETSLETMANPLTNYRLALRLVTKYSTALSAADQRISFCSIFVTALREISCSFQTVSLASLNGTSAPSLRRMSAQYFPPQNSPNSMTGSSDPESDQENDPPEERNPSFSTARRELERQYGRDR